MNILFILFQGGATNLKYWNEHTESKFLDKLCSNDRKTAFWYVQTSFIWKTLIACLVIPFLTKCCFCNLHKLLFFAELKKQQFMQISFIFYSLPNKMLSKQHFSFLCLLNSDSILFSALNKICFNFWKQQISKACCPRIFCFLLSQIIVSGEQDRDLWMSFYFARNITPFCTQQYS